MLTSLQEPYHCLYCSTASGTLPNHLLLYSRALAITNGDHATLNSMSDDEAQRLPLLPPEVDTGDPGTSLTHAERQVLSERFDIRRAGGRGRGVYHAVSRNVVRQVVAKAMDRAQVNADTIAATIAVALQANIVSYQKGEGPVVVGPDYKSRLKAAELWMQLTGAKAPTQTTVTQATRHNVQIVRVPDRPEMPSDAELLARPGTVVVMPEDDD